MHLFHSLLFSLPLALATNLFVSSYSGVITTLSLTTSNLTSKNTSLLYHLTPISNNTGCSPSPSWLTLDPSTQTLYCLDEGLTTPNGSLSSYTIDPSGNLTQLHRASTISGPVSGVIYTSSSNSSDRAIALAHYEGSSVSSWSLPVRRNGNFSFLQSETFSLAQPGPNAARQDAPHEHEALLDPSGKFVLVPDLGADIVRVFAIDPATDELVQESALSVTPGSGPRHGVFYRPTTTAAGGYNATSSSLYFYLVTELGNTVTGYSVSYPETGGMSFEKVFESGVYGNLSMPAGNAAAEIAISPDNRFLTISNRNNTSFQLPSLSPSTSNATVPSDSLSTFSLHANGSLEFLQLWPSGGLYPRQFSFNKKGDLAAVGLQMSSEVVILSRDVESGRLGKPVARVEVDGEVTCVVWDE